MRLEGFELKIVTPDGSDTHVTPALNPNADTSQN